jgi:hypothetical protein
LRLRFNGSQNSGAGVKDAFEHISADEAGYYLLSFEARAEESGGTFNAFSIKVNRPHVQAKGPRYYLVPPDATTSQMPADMMAALQSPQNQKGIGIVANSWLFPDQGTVHWGVFAADLNWLEGAPPKGSRVKIYAELINDSMHGISGTWLEETEWPEQSSTLHWQRDGRVYPGSYMLRVTAMDTASGKIAFGIHFEIKNLPRRPAPTVLPLRLWPLLTVNSSIILRRRESRACHRLPGH